jgi:hypothetical protein|tara:strand:+ start:1492 stop:1740 length:249 start_codon:yes stop_codon:yes gene_type:complete
MTCHSKDTVFKWRLVFKSSPYGVYARREFDSQTGLSYSDISRSGFHDFMGTEQDSCDEWDKWRKRGYNIQDCYNLGIYENDK